MIYIVWNNSGHGEIRRFMDDAKVTRTGVDIASPNYAALAQAMGCASSKANSLADLKEALGKAKQHAAPFLIELDEASLDCGYAF